MLKIELIDGTFVPLRLDIYFLSRVSKITGRMLHELPYYLIGDAGMTEDNVIHGTCGVLVDLECRAAVIAAGMDSANAQAGNPTQSGLVEGFEIMNKMKSALTSETWGTIYTEMFKALIPETSLTQKKSEEEKASPLTGADSSGAASVK